MSRIAVTILFSFSTFSLPAIADENVTAKTEPFDVLDSIIVTATLNGRAQKDIAGETSSIDATQIDRHNVQDIRDLVRYEPGVSVSADPTRFGLSGFSIRGLDGDRVRILVDGISVADSFSIGSFSNAGRDSVDVDSLKRVEIVRGAASSLYGSDAIGGVVSFITKDPSDYLDGGAGQFVSGKFSYASVNRGTTESATYASGNGSDGVVLVATHRDGSAFANKGDVDSDDATRTRPNPQDTASNAVLAKYVRQNADGRVDRITFDGERATDETNALSQLGVNPLTHALTTALLGKDQRQRARLSAGQDIPVSLSFVDSVIWRAYVQNSQTMQDTYQDLTTSASLQRFRRFDFDQTIYGIVADAHKAFATGTAQHELTYGIDVSTTRTAEKRDGFQRNVATGQQTNVVVPDTFPTRDFPISDTTTAAAFVQDEITLGDGHLSLIPGLRVDRYDLDPRDDDALFNAANPGFTPAGLNFTGWSPKFGAIWRFNNWLSTYLQYAHGFRSPPYNDVNFGFTNLQFGYTALPNPDLKPETSNGVEIGLRGDGALGYFSVAAYDNRYHDFIDELEFVGFNESGLMLFQSRNLSRVRIYGSEARVGLKLGSLDSALDGFTLKGNVAYSRGDDRTANQPLTSVDPAKAVAGLAYDRDTWGAELFGTFVKSKRRLPTSGNSGEGGGAPDLFQAPGYSTFDFYAHWQPLSNLRLFATLTNLTDKKYWRWADVRGTPFDASTIDRYSAAGRGVGLGLRVDL